MNRLRSPSRRQPDPDCDGIHGEPSRPAADPPTRWLLLMIKPKAIQNKAAERNRLPWGRDVNGVRMRGSAAASVPRPTPDLYSGRPGAKSNAQHATPRAREEIPQFRMMELGRRSAVPGLWSLLVLAALQTGKWGAGSCNALPMAPLRRNKKTCKIAL